MNRTRLNEVYDEWKSGKGFFHFLFYYFSHASPVISCEFLPDSETAVLLDMKYHGGFSGNKYTSTLIDSYIPDMRDYKDAYFTQFAEIFWKINSENLLRQWEVQKAEYNPLNNYDMREESRDNHSGMNMQNGSSHNETENGGTDTTKTGTDMTTTTGGSEGGEETSIITHKINGFNNTAYDDGANADSTITRDKVHVSGNKETNISELSHGMHTESDGSTSNYSTDTDVNTHELTRSGNIGVTTSTQMLEQHAEFWKRWSFYETILFPAVDKLITISLY